MRHGIVTALACSGGLSERAQWLLSSVLCIIMTVTVTILV
jgi:hypothetical protein